MDLEAYQQKVAEVGPHPGLSEWHKKSVLLYRCRDITEKEFRRRYMTLAEKFEALLEQALPENLEEETYQMAASYYNSASLCLDSYLEGVDEVLHWADTGDEKALEASRRCFARGDKEWNKTLDVALKTEMEFKEMDEAILRSLGAAGY